MYSGYTRCEAKVGELLVKNMLLYIYIYACVHVIKKERK